jgi:hypothetical protein
MNAYAVVGFLIAFGASGFYAAYTVLESRRVAAKVLALQAAQSPTRSNSKSPSAVVEPSEGN